MNEETKPVIGSNEHHEQIEQRLAALESGGSGAETIDTLRNAVSLLQSDIQSLRSSVSGLNGTLGTAQTSISNLQSAVNKLERTQAPSTQAGIGG